MFCGVDEAGRGSVMGPLVVGSVYVESDEALKDIGVKDSKKITPKNREIMYERIVSECVTYCTVIASAKDIDEMRKNKTLNVIELEMFHEATSKIPVSSIYADCPDVNERRFSSLLSSKISNTEVIAEHKADDKYPIVSAASIIAKVTRDRMIEEIQSKIGIKIGSGYPSDVVTMNFIEKWIKENGSPPEHTRCSWEPIRQMLSVSKMSKLY